MLSSTHVLHDSLDDVSEVLLNIGAKNGLIPAETAPGDRPVRWKVGIYRASPYWITVIDSSNNPRGTAAALAHELRVFAIGMMVDDPMAWCFTAFHHDDLVGSYRWKIPLEILAESRKKIREYEEKRLVELGLEDLSRMKSKMNERGRRVVSSDPHVELNYRLKVIGDDIEIPPPRLSPEIPAQLHRITGMSTPARLRKILGTVQLDVSATATEFCAALQLPDWIDPEAFDHQIALQPHKNNILQMRMIEK